jgi:hypothetical protein
MSEVTMHLKVTFSSDDEAAAIAANDRLHDDLIAALTTMGNEHRLEIIESTATGAEYELSGVEVPVQLAVQDAERLRELTRVLLEQHPGNALLGEMQDIIDVSLLLH